MEYIKWPFIAATIFGAFAAFYWLHADDLSPRGFFTFNWITSRSSATGLCLLIFGSMGLIYMELAPQTKVAFWDFLCDLICAPPAQHPNARL